MIWKKLLILGIVLLLISVAIGDYIIENSYKTITLNPSQSITVTQAEVLAKDPIYGGKALGTIYYSVNTYTLYTVSKVIENNQTTPTTVILIENNGSLYFVYFLILISFVLIVLSLIGLFYQVIIKKSIPHN